jgi:hypothetical protein
MEIVSCKADDTIHRNSYLVPGRLRESTSSLVMPLSDLELRMACKVYTPLAHICHCTHSDCYIPGSLPHVSLRRKEVISSPHVPLLTLQHPQKCLVLPPLIDFHHTYPGSPGIIFASQISLCKMNTHPTLPFAGCLSNPHVNSRRRGVPNVVKDVNVR